MMDLGGGDEWSPVPTSGGGVKRNLNNSTATAMKVEEKDTAIDDSASLTDATAGKVDSKSTSSTPGPTTTTTMKSGSSSSNSKKGSVNGNGNATTTTSSSGMDEDLVWAEEDPDEDERGWKMLVSKSAAELAEEMGV
jgi:COMPASS component SWD1